MRLLLTGAAGSIGTRGWRPIWPKQEAVVRWRRSVRAVSLGIPLRLLDRRACAVELPAGAEFVQADLRDLDAVEKASTGVSAVAHLAGITQEGPFPELVEHNVTGTHHVLEAARRQRVRRVVLASSHHVTGLNPVGAPTAPLAPDSFYAVSKVLRPLWRGSRGLRPFSGRRRSAPPSEQMNADPDGCQQRGRGPLTHSASSSMLFAWRAGRLRGPRAVRSQPFACTASASGTSVDLASSLGLSASFSQTTPAMMTARKKALVGVNG